MAISKLIFNNVTQMDVTTTTATEADVASGKTFLLADGTVGTGTASGGSSSNDFVVTLSWNDNYFSQGNGAWVPDKTISELQNAYAEELNIVFITDQGNPTSWYYDDDYIYIYSVLSGGNNLIVISEYEYNTQGILFLNDAHYIFPDFDSPSRTYTPTESQQTESITYDSSDGFNGIDTVSVIVNAIPSNYVGSGITQRSSTDLTVSEATVTAPAGYYASNASKSVTTMTLPTAVSSSATSGYTSKATVSRSTSDQYINIPTGYNSAGGYYKINAVANGSATGPSSLSGSSATVTTGTNTLTLTKTGVTTTPTVSAGYISSATASTATVALTASVTTKAAATITPSTSDQTIASGTYLTGTQTIEGDANLIAGNIKKDTSIFGVTGTYEGSGGGSGGDTKFVTGTFTTSSSTSTNGTVSVNYSGSGYPIMLVIVVEGGCYDSSISPWYNSLTRYAVGQFIITKGDTSTTPGYTTSGSDNYGTVQVFYKNSTSTATSYTSTRSATANSYSSSNANGTSTTCVRWTGNKTISYRTGGGGSSSYGLLAGQTYRYYVYYSS